MKKQAKKIIPARAGQEDSAWSCLCKRTIFSTIAEEEEEEEEEENDDDDDDERSCLQQEEMNKHETGVTRSCLKESRSSMIIM